MLDEQSLRKSMIAGRRELETLLKPENKKIADNCIKLIDFINVKNVMIYLPLRGEADISGLINKNLSLFVPVTHGTEIRPAEYTAETALVKGEFGVMVPEAPIYAEKSRIDMVLVPAVAVDRNKNRMGFGKGCYDRFLTDMDCVKAAVCFDFQIVEALEPKPHDIKMDYIITESGYF
ncbi:MAG: 5-formyltetrahydrofolate cyclo-ligase [Clostridia bacterium]